MEERISNTEAEVEVARQTTRADRAQEYDRKATHSKLDNVRETIWVR